MTRFWWLNPWAEVQRLRQQREEGSKSFDWLFGEWQRTQAQLSCCMTDRDRALEENAELKRQIAKMEREPLPF